MGIDPRAIGGKRARLLGRALPSQDQTCLGGFHVQVAKLSDGHSRAQLVAVVSRIFALYHASQLHLGLFARLLGRERAERPDLKPPLASAAGSELDDERLPATLEDTHAEALKLTIPEQRSVLRSVRLQPLDHALGQFRHGNLPFPGLFVATALQPLGSKSEASSAEISVGEGGKKG